MLCHHQIRKMSFASPFTESTSVRAIFAERIAEYAPGDLKRVFFTSGGSSAAVDSALRFVMFYNNVRGLRNKKKIIGRQDAYHGSTLFRSFLFRKRKR